MSQTIALNCNRSLYKVSNERGDVVAFITGSDVQQVFQRYHSQGGSCQSPTAERMTFGYPCDELEVFA